MSKDIFVIRTMGDALRNTGYKSIESAMSEIIDNSIQANAKNVFVIVSESLNSISGRKEISEIAFLDNGSGMDMDTLEGCLGIGFSTRMDRKGMGRFGVGLPQASLYACPRVEVYSWQNGFQNCLGVYLDIDQVKNGQQTVIEDPERTFPPLKYKDYIKYKAMVEGQPKEFNFETNGTLVIWKNCDRVEPKTLHFLFKRLDFEIGKKFRYFIKDSESSIKLIADSNRTYYYDVMPNDPLLLMEPNYVLGNPKNPGNIDEKKNLNCTEPLFEPYETDRSPNGVIVIPIKYRDANTYEIKVSNVEITFSKVKDIFYDKTAIASNPGSTPMGKHVKKLEGISIVRANREIDFGRFDFYENVNQPEHRWWGCEIRFNPELDEAFGVANNKQHVELKRVYADDYADEEVKPVWLQLYNVVSDTISSIYRINKKTRENARVINDIVPPSTKIINSVEEHSSSNNNSESKHVRETTPESTLIERATVELVNQGLKNPSDSDIKNYMQNEVNIVYKNMGSRGLLFDYSFELGNCKVELNMDHPFYVGFLEDAMKNTDSKTAFELFIASMVKVFDETKISQSEENDNMFTKWNGKLREYINEQQNFAKKR